MRHFSANLQRRNILNYEIDLGDEKEVELFFEKEKDILGVIHFAALKSVGESVEKPILYFRNNMNSLVNILDQIAKRNIGNFIFSSSCTVYGQATELPVTESSPMKEAESPYGRTKQLGEYIIKDIATLKGLNALSLRYFNPAGAHSSGLLGEAPKVKALNLVPVITETAAGKRTKCFVHGNDYPTRDGTCIRDYIHVMDLANAHTLALKYLLEKRNKSSYEVFNLGIGDGVSVLEAIQAFERVSDKQLNYEIGPRRPGDVTAIYSNYKKAQDLLGWSPQHDIDDIMSSAWNWEQKRHF